MGGPPVLFRRITVRTIENTAALEANLLSGTIDMIAGELGLSLDEALAFEKRHGGAFQIIYKPGLVFEHIDLNLDLPLLSDRRVRQALLLGLDREAISRSLFGGRQPVADSFMNPLDRGFSSKTPRYRHDPQRAAALLDEAGWKLRSGGLRGNESGQALSVELKTTAGNRTRELVQQVLQSQWRKIGVDMTLKNEPARVLFGETMRNRRFELAMYAWISGPENVPRSISALGGDSERGQRVRRPEHAGLPKRRGGPADRRARNRAGSGEAAGDVGRAAAPVRDRAAFSAALFPVQLVHSAEMAQGRAADRKSVAVHVVDHRVVGAAVDDPAPSPAEDRGLSCRPFGPERDDPLHRHPPDRDRGTAGADVVRHLRADRADAGRPDRPDALGRPAHERRGCCPAESTLRRRPAAVRPLPRVGAARRSAANSAIRGCSRRRSRRCCCRGSAIRCC